VKDSNPVEEDNSYATSFALADLGTEFGEERFDVAPTDVRARRVSEDRVERLLVLPRALWYRKAVLNGKRLVFVTANVGASLE